MDKTEISENQASCQDVAKLPQKEYSNIKNCDNLENSNTNTQDNSLPAIFSFIWVGLFLLAIAVSLAGQTIVSYQPYALSEFNAHSMLSVIGTVQYILYV